MDVQKFSYSVRTCLHSRRPAGIIKSINVFGNPTIEKIGDAGWRFEFGTITGELEYGFNECQNIVELLVGRIEWMVSNGYELNLQ